MKTKLLFLGAILFWILASRTDDLLFFFFAVYLTALWISFFFFKWEQKREAKSDINHQRLKSQAASPKTQ
jgi:hypothetical protein